MSSPTPSTIENVIRSDASSPHEYSLAAPLTTMDLEQVLQQFPDPTQPPDSDDSLAAPKPITSGLDINEPVVVRTTTAATIMPYMLTCPTTHQCRQATQRYAYPVPLEDLTAQSLTNHDVQYVARTARSQEDL